MFRFNKIINVKIRDFEPLTDNDNTIERKEILLKKIKNKINLEKAKRKCENILFSLNIVYYLNADSKIEGQYKKDLDNMTKIVADVLTDYLTAQNKQNEQKTGLGLIRDDKDIHELHLTKKFVGNNAEQGLDIVLYKWSKK
jgi:Holliday junction resolvase RusA-like endonuclease